MDSHAIFRDSFVLSTLRCLFVRIWSPFIPFALPKRPSRLHWDVQANTVVDLVTAVDKACEDQIIGMLRARYPNHGTLVQ